MLRAEVVRHADLMGYPCITGQHEPKVRGKTGRGTNAHLSVMNVVRIILAGSAAPARPWNHHRDASARASGGNVLQVPVTPACQGAERSDQPGGAAASPSSLRIRRVVVRSARQRESGYGCNPSAVKIRRCNQSLQTGGKRMKPCTFRESLQQVMRHRRLPTARTVGNQH